MTHHTYATSPRQEGEQKASYRQSLPGRLLRSLAAPLQSGWALIVFGLAGFWLNYWFTDYPRPQFRPYFWLCAADLYIVAALLGLLPSRWRLGLKGVWHGGMYLLGFIESFLYRRFYIIYAPTALTLLMETDSGEASEFLQAAVASRHLWPSLWPWLLLLGLHLLTLALPRLISRLRWPSPLPYAHQALGIGACALLLWQAPVWLKERTALAEFLASSTTGEAEKASSGIFYSGPLRLLSAAKFYALAQDELALLARNLNTVQVDSCRFQCPHIVLVVGESYNKHHSQLYGYAKPTTPRQKQLAEAGELVAFSDVVTPWNLTSSVFKNMLSTHSADQAGSWTDGVLFPAVFLRAGYHVSFLTNQFQATNRQNKADFNGSFFLNDERFSRACFSHRSKRRYKYDRGLLAELTDSTLQAVTQPRLTIVHLIGQHVAYAERFPADQTRFRAADYHRPDLTAADRQIIADYDNATLFNDSVVGRLCDHFAADDAIVIYLADHGDEVFDGQVGMYGRNHSAELTPAVLRGEFEVPFEIWASSRFRQARPALWQKVVGAAARPFMIDDLPHLLFGLAGIACPQYDPQRDLLSDDYAPCRPRLLKGGLGDYDHIMGRSGPR